MKWGALTAVLLALALGIWLWWDGSRRRESALPQEDVAGTISAPEAASATGLQGSPVPTSGGVPRAASADAPGQPGDEKRIGLRIRGAGGEDVATAWVRVLRDRGGEPAAPLPGTPMMKLDLPARVQALAQTSWVEVRFPGGPADTSVPLAGGTFGPFPADSPEIDIELPPERSISGHVLDARGRPVAGVSVTAYIEPAQAGAWEREATTTSQEDGTFRLGRLRAGTCHIETWPSGAHAPAPTVTVESGATGVELRLRPGLLAVVTVQDAAGRPVAEALVRVSLGVKRGVGHTTFVAVASGHTDARGEVRLGGLDPSISYQREILPQRTEDVVSRRDAAWTPSSETVLLQRALSIRGVCRYVDGTPFPLADVSVHVDNARVPRLSTTANRDGVWTVNRVPEGPVRLQAHYWRPDGVLTAGPLAARAGDDDVVLVLHEDPLGTVDVTIANWPEDPREAWAWLTAEKDGVTPNAAGPGTRLTTAGTVRFERQRLTPRYTFYAATPDRTRCAYERNLDPRAPRHEIALRPALAIRGRLSTPSGATDQRVYVSGNGVAVGAVVSPAGDFVLGGLPPGNFTVGASAKLEGRLLSASVEAAAGDAIELELR
ncbi:MAG: carboxypeptidase regulatory-like domain-containing protein [Planctomycetes bacterium]|nr:carboxypeptidase regulatory-like domain-containing protein [Planctomycetota bacterium]MCB9830222.1 carboxypeptidase regulatory-like domain-containing protein [Planctomycetota bacterium]MCB9902141.1 carboxypeptidase regulatory-like domain-containing protein [Planctomycetota bacterium]